MEQLHYEKLKKLKQGRLRPEKYKEDTQLSTITIEIKAPELAHALETLAIAIGCTVDKIGVGQAIQEAVSQAPLDKQLIQQAPIQQPMQQIPIQPQIQQPMPQMQPAAMPQMQQPIQQAPIQSIPTTPAQPLLMPQQQMAVPTQVQAYTMDQLAVAATQLMDAGKRNDLIALLGQFGVPALTALPKDQYGAFATALRGMGAKI